MRREIIFWNPKIDFENGAADDDYSPEKNYYKKFKTLKMLKSEEWNKNIFQRLNITLCPRTKEICFFRFTNCLEPFTSLLHHKDEFYMVFMYPTFHSLHSNKIAT